MLLNFYYLKLSPCFKEMGSCYVAKAGPKLLDSRYPLALASRAGTRGVHSWNYGRAHTKEITAVSHIRP